MTREKEDDKPVIIFPAEWHEQDGVVMTWPHKGTDWAPFLEEVEGTYFEIARKLSKNGVLIITCQNAESVKSFFPGNLQSEIRFYEIPCNDTWARDFGPLCTINDGKAVINKFRFNGWGNKFDAMLDDRITAELFSEKAFNPDCLLADHSDFVLEGGSIETDGKGTILTTSGCLLNSDRNSGFPRYEIENRLEKYLGAKRILWLDYGRLAGDDTDGHIDTLARFGNENTICYVRCDDPNDEHYNGLKKMEEQLGTFRTVKGKPYLLVPLPMAEPVFDSDAGRLPATYANFLIINDSVLVPVYGSETDKHALKVFSRLFPGREITGINCSSLIKQGGSLHCITMQIPKGFLK